jgi:hypothetical protein
VRTLADSVVDGGALLEVAWVSLAAGLGVTAVFAVGIVGATKAADMRRDGRPGEAAAYVVLAALAVLGVTAAVVFALIVMTTK